ncbi:CHASE2 domain-containing protein [Arcobacter sp. CECT 8983]|uniref:CHASE2 domain-containing protein n=1 Tax=Arcobacter sp. CECT 8983 TaxID=2044508 RepID=UPI00215A0970|nr:adenylate/guanylate cyclase domain-containing protein [Arcobacter sp. CECT 8983]
MNKHKKKAIKKFLLYFLVSIFIAIFSSTFYIFFPKLPDSIDNRLRDTLFNIRGEISNTNNVIIIDIDEKSLNKLGQWPWQRNKVSKILQNLTQNEIGLIAFDIVFAEEDNSSPHKVFEEFGIKKENIPNYDLDFAKTVATTPTILGYVFELEQKKHLGKRAPEIPAIIVEKNKQLGNNSLIKAYGTILNIPLLQSNSYSSGFFNNIPDNSGIIRSVPLVISYDDIIYPSLSLEVLRIITQTKRVIVNYDEQGIENISLGDLKIPTDRYGRILVNFRGKEGNFKYYSAIDIYENKIDKKELEGKIALIGTSAVGLLDLRATPFESIYPGVEVHANVIDNIIKGDFIYKASWIDGANVTLIFLLSIITVLLITYTPFWFNPLGTILLLGGFGIFTYYVLFTHGIVLNIFFPLATIIFAAIIATLFDYFYEIKQEEAIKKKFAAKVSKEVMDNLLKNIDSNEFQAMEKEVTVFFSDVRGFTNISEQMNNAKKLISYLNEYMEPMSNIITKYEGTIDKYIGDAIMAYWNAPADVKNHADKAVSASLYQIKELEPLNKKLEKENKPLIDIGIGLNTGLAIVGEMGSSLRSDYTVIGDTINLGARLESLCKYYDSKLNISNFTKEKLEKEYIFRFLDYVTVKGKNKPIEIWQVIDFGKPNETLQKELDLYHKAIKLYKDSKFNEALKIFEDLQEDENKSNKKIYKLYIKRCKEFILTPPKDFNGVYKHNTKS